jgi:hypothetical protein
VLCQRRMFASAGDTSVWVVLLVTMLKVSKERLSGRHEVLLRQLVECSIVESGVTGLINRGTRLTNHQTTAFK